MTHEISMNVDNEIAKMKAALDSSPYGVADDEVIDIVRAHVEGGSLNNSEFALKAWKYLNFYLDSTTCRIKYDFSSHTGLYDDFEFVMNKLFDFILADSDDDGDIYALLRLLSTNFTLEKCIRCEPEKMLRLLQKAVDECWSYEYMFMKNPEAYSVDVPVEYSDQYSKLFETIKEEVYADLDYEFKELADYYKAKMGI